MSADGLQRVLVTGGNSGLGYNTCRKLALQGVPHVILSCRSRAKGEAAVASLAEETKVGAGVFTFLVMDMCDLDTCKAAAESIQEPLNAVILNAGGAVGGPGPTKEGVTGMFSANVLGHAMFLEILLAREMIAPNGAVMYAGSETARGVPGMTFARPVGVEPTVDNLDGWVKGTSYDKFKPEVAYAYDKLVAALYMSALARRFSQVYFITMSPGATGGTSGISNAFGACAGACFSCCVFPILKCCGWYQTLDDGTARYMRAVSDRDLRAEFPSGTFVASDNPKMATGKLCDQAEIWDIFAQEQYQEAAYEVVHRHLPEYGAAASQE